MHAYFSHKVPHWSEWDSVLLKHVDLMNLLCICVNKIWIYVISCVHLAGQPLPICLTTLLAWQNFNVGQYLQTLKKFFHTCHACNYEHHWLIPFYTTFIDLNFASVSQGQCKAKHFSFIFFDTFLLPGMGLCGGSTNQTEYPDTTFEWDILNLAVLLTALCSPPPLPPFPLPSPTPKKGLHWYALSCL